ncbi:type I pullulanase [Oenococcus sicerae]|uniref:Type I pullulanase n=1 Tax=Oenococcus sicerae TaxID=2203724 RepID=A0AAJ1RC32_9LACO|nr:type I pullulanase [Oenococcus sicerae]MDN6900180.1 type I pullulanase [Oenococcus sicerae]
MINAIHKSKKKTATKEEKYAYTEEDLGYQYSKTATSFKLWSPSAAEVFLIEYANTDTSNLDTVLHRMDKLKTSKGVYAITLLGDHERMIYAFQIKFLDGKTNITRDPYAKAATINGDLSVVANLVATDPPAFKQDSFKRVNSPTQAIVYEMHIRDFSISPTSGVSQKNRAIFLGVTESGSKNPKHKTPAGLDYLQYLGINYVQIQPIFDYATVDEANPLTKYNWGYDPKNYNVPEGSYSTNPAEPYQRITELKRMIQKLHEARIGVIMDVVYNHTYMVDQSSLEASEPNYFFRKKPDGNLSNGTGVGNDTASEKTMFRKYMLDSLSYWVKEYHIDGFRFDLMGIHDIETMQQIRNAMNAIDPKILLYGEGWDLDTSLPSQYRANQNNAAKLKNIGFFSDQERNLIKGDGRSNIGGFVSQTNSAKDNELLFQNILGHPNNGSYITADQVVQYVEAHDDLNLNDKLMKTDPEDSEYTHYMRDTLATTLVLLSAGMPFIQAGQEFLRSKGGDYNSYNSPDSVNAINWNYVDKYHHGVALLRKLIRFRKKINIYQLNDFASIAKRMVQINWIGKPSNVISYKIDNNFLVVANASMAPIQKNDIFKAQGNFDFIVLSNDYASNAGHLKQYINPLAIQVMARTRQFL